MLVTTSNECKAICAAAREAGSVALDTEFVWQRTYHPCLGIVQLALPGGHVYLIDAVALPGLDGLGEVLADPQTRLILHDAIQDLQILCRHTDVAPRNVFDTRRAAGFAGLDSTISLANLLKETLNLDLAKDETRSDWLQRPLTPTQAEYARADVLYLHETTDILETKARERGTAEALAAELERFDDPDLYQTANVDTLYSRIRTARQPHETRAAIYTLLRWREQEAIERDRPRGHILKDADLMQIAINLTAKPPTHAPIPKRYAAQIHAALQEAANLTPQSLPPSEPNLRLSAEVKQAIDARRKRITQNATDARIDPALVANKAEITALVLYEQGIISTPPSKHLITGWRTKITEPMPPPAMLAL